MANEKTAIVTGGNRGMGFETCRQLGRLGFKVILCCRDPQAGNTPQPSSETRAQVSKRFE